MATVQSPWGQAGISGAGYGYGQLDASGAFSSTLGQSPTNTQMSAPMKAPSAGGFGMGGSNLGMGSQSGGVQFGQNPYLQGQMQSLEAMSNQNLGNNVMPMIRQGAQANGQYGSSRQGVAEGVAAANAQAGVSAAQANLMSNGYRDDQNFYLGNQGQMQNFYTQQRGQDQSGIALGASLYGQGNTGNLGIGAGQYQLGQTAMNAPLTSAQNYAGIINPYMGLNGSSTTGGGSSSTSTVTDSGSAGQKVGGGLQGFAGGALAGWQAGSNLGLG